MHCSQLTKSTITGWKKKKRKKKRGKRRGEMQMPVSLQSKQSLNVLGQGQSPIQESGLMSLQYYQKHIIGRQQQPKKKKKLEKKPFEE